MKIGIKMVARTIAFIFALCATGGAWAAKPKAVWYRDLADASSRGGFTIDINNGTATENLNTVADGVVTIGSGSNGGVRFMRSEASGYQLSAMARINPGANPTLTSTPVLYSLRNAYSGSKDIIGVGFGTDGKMYATWDKANNGTGSSSAISFADAFTYTASRFWCASSSDATSTHGTYGYWGGTQQVHNNACRNDAQTMYGVTIGGTYEANADNLSGAKIDYVVIFDDATGDVVTDITNFSVSGMTAVGSDLGVATTATGVNLPASATLTAAATPAAVFVQQTSTLTMTGSASLMVNSGTGPLYVADGTTLTIDATGIDVTGVSAGDMVNLVSGKIYGTDLITVKAPVKSGLTITSAITDAGITLTAYEACTVSFTSPFDGTTLAAPTTGTGWYTTQASASFGNKTAYHQTINAKSAIVAKVTGGEYSTALNGFLATGEAADNATMDVYLDVAGGSGRSVCGVQRCAWQGAPFTAATTGDAIVQIEGGTYQYVFGAGEQGAYNNSVATVTGNTGVTIKGSGKVSGSVFGGWSSSHNKTPSVSGNTAVRIENVQDVDTASSLDYIGKGFIVGGSTFQANSSSPTSVGGNSSVTVALGNSASGTFAKKIVGGSLIPEITDTGKGGGAQAVTGNASVSITAPSEVTFSQLIVGGGYNGHQGSKGSVTVGGNSSVTLSGGTYTGRIVAGSYANVNGTASVAGTATLTLNSGTFTGATLDGGNATGAKTLVVGDNLDISAATVTGFTAVTLGDGATAQMETGEEGTATLGSGAVLKLIIDDADIADGYTPSVSGAGTVEYYEYVESVLTQITDAARLDGNNLRASAPIWSPASADASGNLADTARWSTGALPENDASIVKFVVNGNNTLTVNETRTFGHVHVEGSGTLLLEGDGTHHLTVGYLDVASGTTVTINDADDPLYVTDGTIDGSGTLTLANGANLTLDGVTKTSSVSLTVPSGTTLTIGGDGTTTLPLGDRVIAGNIVIEDGATLVSTTNDAPDYDHACNVYIYGTLTLNARWSMNANNKIYCYTGATINGTGDSAAALDLLNQNTTIYVNPHPDTQATGTVTCSAKIRLRGNATVNVAEGMTFLITGNTIKQNDNCGYTKTGSGLLHIKGAFTPGGTTTVSAGKILFEDTNIGSTDLPGALAGSGTVEFKSTSAHDYFYASASGFTGKIIVTKAGSTWPHIIGTAPQTSSATPPELEVSGGVVLTHTLNNASFYVKDLSGSGTIDTGYGTIANNDHTPRTIDVLLTKNSAFGGIFSYSDNSYKHRNACLTVRGADDAESVYALTLSGVSTSYGPLVVENNAKVVFTSTGSWRNGSVTVENGGWLESTNATVLTSLTLADGANIVFPTSSSALTGITSLTFESGTTYISFADGVTPTAGTLIDWSGASLESAPAGTFQLVGSVASDWILTKSETGLSIAAAAAKVTPTTGDPVAYASVDVALGAFMSAMATDEGVVLTILDGTPVSTPQDQLATAGVYYDSEAGTLTKAVAKTSAKPYNSLASAVADVESGATITLLRASSEAIALSKAITLIETAAYSGTLSGSGTLTLSALRSSALTFGNWTGTVVLPQLASIAGDTFSFNSYGVEGSTVRVSGIGGGWLKSEEVNPTIDIPEGVTLTISDFSPSFNNTFKALSGAGTFAVTYNTAIDTTSGSWYSGYSAYFLIKNASNFTGSLTTATPGIVIGSAKPEYRTAGGKIILTTSATIAAGKTWTATGGIVLADAAATLTNTDGALDPVPTTTVSRSRVVSSTSDGTTTYTVEVIPGTIFSVY